MIIHTVGNIPTLAAIPEALAIALTLAALIVVERIAAFALHGIEEHRRNKLIPLICFNSMAAAAFCVLFALNAFGGPLVLALAFTTVLNLALTVTRWQEYGKMLVEANNCSV
ncbi:unnamed protein product [Toxocara canis]|uniref:Hydrogenase-4 component E n=1 Tax=Toxocara canis TaxID=6265 RepID=A0A183U0R8_TOXCA|nr:unnamed protein product [Toxocara canis]